MDTKALKEGLQETAEWIQLDALLHSAVSQGVFPGAVALGAVDGAILFHEAYGWANRFTRMPMTPETVFDLASLTKPLSTTLAVLSLVNAKKLDLEKPVASFLKELDIEGKRTITLRHLLTHRSGYPAWRPYFEAFGHLAPDTARARIREQLVKEPLENVPGEVTLYSDLGFMVLDWLVESVTQTPAPVWVTVHIFSPLNINGLFFPNAVPGDSSVGYAATELCPWRLRLLEGCVHDDNAFVMGGASGHAGLFGTAKGVWQILTVLLKDAGTAASGRLLPRNLARQMFRAKGDAQRPLGMDVPSGDAPSCGRYFSRSAVGHLGFTGTSFWVDPERCAMVILLTNRVHPSRSNIKIRSFRPMFHDAMMAFLFKNRFLAQEGAEALVQNGVIYFA